MVFTLLLPSIAAEAGERPQVWALGVSSATGNSCTLAGLVNPQGASTWAWFEWGTTTNYGALTLASDMGSGTNALHFGAPVTGLSPATTYHFRAAATNLYGGAYGNDLTFTTPSLPQVLTASASEVAANTAMLNGTVNPEGSATTAWFEWGRTTSYGNRTAATDLGSGADALPLLVPIGGLSPGLTYHFRLAATNIFGAAYGDDRILTTLNLPQVVTSPATAVATNRATLNASINPRGLPTAAWFEWGTTPSYGTFTPASDMGNGTGFLPLTAVLEDLTPGMTYYFRAAATNNGGSAYGGDWTFTTPGPPRVWTLPATAVTTERATLNGGVNPDGYATTAWFEWGTNTSYGNLSSATAMGNGTGALPLSFPLEGLEPRRDLPLPRWGDQQPGNGLRRRPGLHRAGPCGHQHRHLARR